MFFKGSRYANVETAQITDPSGRVLSYKKARYIGQPPARKEHVVTQGDRLDLLAHLYFRDSERFWRICDANLALWPPDLMATPGRRIKIPGSED